MGRKLTIHDEYFDWLYSLVSPRRSNYRLLCQELHRKIFTWSVHNDDNRCSDGIALRDLFVEEARLDEDHVEVVYFLKGECTFLEVLVALAQRIDGLMYNLNGRNNTSRWFMEMISNLGLENCTDDLARGGKFSQKTCDTICDTSETVTLRTYKFDGRGGLFPLKRRPPKDQAKVEIWYQLMLYLDENYGH